MEISITYKIGAIHTASCRMILFVENQRMQEAIRKLRKKIQGETETSYLSLIPYPYLTGIFRLDKISLT